MAHLRLRLRAFYDPNAWVLILLGLVLFSARVQFSPGGWVNLPVAFTVLQTGGLMFSLFGLQIMASMAVWPHLDLSSLMLGVQRGSVAAAITLMGLLVFNGLSVVGFAIWLTSALGAGMGAQ